MANAYLPPDPCTPFAACVLESLDAAGLMMACDGADTARGEAGDDAAEPSP